MWLWVVAVGIGGLFAYQRFSSPQRSLKESERAAWNYETLAFKYSQAGLMKDGAQAARDAASTWRHVAEIRNGLDPDGRMDALKRAAGNDNLASRWQPTQG